ncbi:MAG: glycosyl hydrolase family 28 protein [Bacillota bacterium]|nr:glycosyl hydrolase family 28 protein [Bacillota bacterium]
MITIPEMPIDAYETDILSGDYEVRINGKPCQVLSCRVSAIPFNRIWPGYQRSIDQTELASHISFNADEEVTLEVISKRSFKRAVVRPLSKNIKVQTENEKITFTLAKPGQYVLEPDDEHFALHIFFNGVENYPEKDKATYYFGPGVHIPGIIKLKSNESIYIDAGAVVFGSVFCDGAENVKIFGHGIMDDSSEERAFYGAYTPGTKGNMKMYNTKNIEIDGVIFRNSAIWVMAFFDCENIVINNIKIVGQWRYNTDGIDLVNSSNITIKNTFVRAFDDVISIKGIYESPKAVENILVENCVLWCGWGRTCEIGIETSAKEYKNITFKNCDLIHNSASAIDIQNGNTGDIHNITFENLNVEYQVSTRLEIFQASDEQKYDGKITGVPILIWADNHKFNTSRWKVDKNSFAGVRDILYKNIFVNAEKGVPPIKIHIMSLSENTIFENFTIDGLFYNGKKVESLKEFIYETNNNVKNVILK